MKIGVHVPQWGDSADRAGVLDVAQAAEECGIDSIWVADHIVFPVDSATKYPYRADGTPFGAEDGFLEALTLLAVVAGATSRVGLGTSVLVLPMRDPLTTAKVATTIDVMSGGRLQLAVGAGWWREEFDALGQEFDGRGTRMDEQIDILKSAWTKPSFSHAGEAYRFAELACTPLPVRAGGPPILIGGMGARAQRRAAERGDGWHAVGADLEVLREGRARIDARASEVGRDPAEIMISTSAGVSSNPERAVARLRELAGIGIGQVVLNFDGDAAAIIERVQWLGDHVLPEVHGS
ncbi:MAG: TIGR03619 family F420-dependent LLM class oxidoreductase [Nocardioidaceae bacterium]|nr:MAG: TIGR03619 family F420-dependent LLM class oxidoreductase [Nocardioidaceae bacterium]